MERPVIFLIGPPQHGKTEARKLVCKLTGLKGASCSDVINAILAHAKNIPVEKLKETPKEQLRPEQIKAGDWLCGMEGPGIKELTAAVTDDEFLRIPSALVRSLYHAGIRVIDGARRSLELDQARAHLQWNGVRSLVIWIEKTGGPSITDNTTVKREQADEHVANDGTLKDLEQKLHVVLLKHFPPAKPAGPQILDGLGQVAGAAKAVEIIWP